MKISTQTVTIILCLLAYSVVYNIKQYRKLKDHHREIAKSTISLITEWEKSFDCTIEKDTSLNAKEKDEALLAKKSFSILVFQISESSIEKIYNELSDDQKQIVCEIRQNIFDDQLTQESNE